MIAKKINTIIFDWAGTTVDFGCRAPLMVFLELFKRRGIPITVEEASQPMGKLKIEHIRELLNHKRIKQEFVKLYKKEPGEDIVKDMNYEFESELFKLLPTYSKPLPRVVKTIEMLRNKGLRIGSTTGYTKPMMDIVAPEAEKFGFKTDYLVTSDQVKRGRPYPNMIFENANYLDSGRMCNVIKVGDTTVDILEGKNAGCWSVGVVEGSSLLGMNYEEYLNADKEEIMKRRERAKMIFMDAGADFVIKSMDDLPGLIHMINNNMEIYDLMPGGQIIYPKQPYSLFTPGPITTSPTVKLSMMTDWGSREQNYLDLVQEVRKDLVELAVSRNQQNYSTVIMQGSGTFGVEACISSVIPREGKLLVLINGEYGKRMYNIAKLHNVNCVDYTVEENQVHTSEQLDKILSKDKDITHVGYIHSETTTGILNPIEVLNPVIKKHRKVSIVDAMSSFGAIPIDMEALGIDFLISSSNKNLEGVPGVSFVIAKKIELDKAKSYKQKTLSLDLVEQYDYLNKTKGGFRFTSPVHVIRALHQAIVELKEEGGVEARNKRYWNMHKTLVEGMQNMNFKKYDLGPYQGPIITTYHSPNCPNYNFKDFYETLKHNLCVIYPGKLAKIDSFRIGTIGAINVGDIEFLLQTIKHSITWNNNL